MKKETQELINWIKDFLWEEKGHCKGNVHDFERFDKAIKFLNTLPNIEEKLCLGGYIQDKNGIPCCHGDKVKFQYDEGFYSGILTWNLTFKCFTIVNKNGIYFWINNGIKWFEKEN